MNIHYICSEWDKIVGNWFNLKNDQKISRLNKVSFIEIL